MSVWLLAGVCQVSGAALSDQPRGKRHKKVFLLRRSVFAVGERNNKSFFVALQLSRRAYVRRESKGISRVDWSGAPPWAPTFCFAVGFVVGSSAASRIA